MSDDRRDEETGRALGRAIGSQTVRETAYASSRLAQRVDRPAARGWTYALPLAAALALFVAMGWFFARGPQGVATPSQTSPTPTMAASAVPSSTTAPASPVATVPALVYFGRDGLPPVPGMVQAAPLSATPSDRIRDRVTALLTARNEDAPSGSINAVSVRRQANAQPTVRVTAQVNGDLATVDIDISDGWQIRGAAAAQAAVRQLVYTITEEPGIRRATINSNGMPATIDQLTLGKPLAREDVSGYTAKVEDRIVAEDQGVPATATAAASNDVVAPGLGRVAIELRGDPAPAGGFWSPRFTAELRQNDELASPRFVQGKWLLQVSVPGATHGAAPIQIAGAPILEVRQGQSQAGAIYSIGLTDARPWRVAVEPGSAPGTMRVLVDIGGHPSAVANGTAVYSPRPGAAVSRSFAVSGAARAFEATVSWRVRDSTGREVAKGFTSATVGTSAVWGTFAIQAQLPASVTGNVTLDVYEVSPRDGSDTNKVEIPLTIR